jgi:fatty acid desaturase
MFRLRGLGGVVVVLLVVVAVAAAVISLWGVRIAVVLAYGLLLLSFLFYEVTGEDALAAMQFAVPPVA